jgi:CRISPR-associated endoribonuclease Cas6
MRIHLHLTPNIRIVPFNYQQNLVGAFHKWLGKNIVHDSLSLYSLSWLRNGKAVKNGLSFDNGAQWFISSIDTDMIRKLLYAIPEDPTVNWGMEVHEITMQTEPYFTNEASFRLCSPVFIKRTVGKKIKYYLHTDSESGGLMTETLQHKLKSVGLNDSGVEVRFDSSYPNPQTKKITFNNIDSRASLCPVIIKGSPEQIAFAWNVGVGNSTGIGFGSLL